MNAIFKIMTLIKIRHKYFIYLLLSPFLYASAQKNSVSDFAEKMETLLQEKTIRPFNGTVVISRNDSILYIKTQGFSDSKNRIALHKNDRYFIGSISKQITAVLVLQAFEKNKLQLNKAIGNYLPNLKMPWKDKVTIHHLLNHTHGIQSLDKPLAFSIGSKFEYSGLGYGLLGEILERVYAKSFADIVQNLCITNGLTNTTYPNANKKRGLTKGHIKNDVGVLQVTTYTPDNYTIPAGGIISNSIDLLKWNKILHTENLLKNDTYAKLITPSAKQNHSLFGDIGYAYGLRISENDGIKEIGHTGYVPGFIAMNLYYPKSNLSLIVLENLDWNDNAIKKTFSFELEIRKILRKSTLVNKL